MFSRKREIRLGVHHPGYDNFCVVTVHTLGNLFKKRQSGISIMTGEIEIYSLLYYAVCAYTLFRVGIGDDAAFGGRSCASLYGSQCFTQEKLCIHYTWLVSMRHSTGRRSCASVSLYMTLSASPHDKLCIVIPGSRCFSCVTF